MCGSGHIRRMGNQGGHHRGGARLPSLRRNNAGDSSAHVAGGWVHESEALCVTVWKRDPHAAPELLNLDELTEFPSRQAAEEWAD